jgi:hypothetical protein
VPGPGRSRAQNRRTAECGTDHVIMIGAAQNGSQIPLSGSQMSVRRSVRRRLRLRRAAGKRSPAATGGPSRWRYGRKGGRGKPTQPTRISIGSGRRASARGRRWDRDSSGEAEAARRTAGSGRLAQVRAHNCGEREAPRRARAIRTTKKGHQLGATAAGREKQVREMEVTRHQRPGPEELVPAGRLAGLEPVGSGKEHKSICH